MNKSIIVLDTPQCCNECILCRSRKGIDKNNCYHACYYPHKKGNDFYLNIIQDVETKPDWCPLSPLPEPKDLTKYLTGSSTFDKAMRHIHDKGYNDCLYEINGGNL